MPSELRFAVLGPVRAWRGDTELTLGAPQQRAVLAMLLLAEGRQVTLEALIDGLWDDPPLAATGTVRTYVSRLRRRLGPARPIESAGAGYAAQSGFNTQAWRLALIMQQFYQQQGYWHDWTATMRSALRAALDDGDRVGQAHRPASPAPSARATSPAERTARAARALPGRDCRALT